MRQVINRDQFTPTGIFIREYCVPYLIVSNLDYLIIDPRTKRIMIVEEKQNNGKIHQGQRFIFKLLDEILKLKANEFDYEYWGFFVLTLKHKTTIPGPGMTLNGKPVSSEALVNHFNFTQCHCDPMQFN